ncbi:MAG: TrmH family RNA methyltransferase [Hyphomonadaceae bacterium]
MQTSESILAQIAKRDNPQTVISLPSAVRPARYARRRADHWRWKAFAIRAISAPSCARRIRSAPVALVLLGESCDPFSVEAVPRRQHGSIFAMPVARASFDELIAFKTRRGAQLVGASLKGSYEAEARIGARVVLLMGNEQSGLPPEMEAACDVLVKLPMKAAPTASGPTATAVML